MMNAYTPCELPRWYRETFELIKLLREKTESREIAWQREHDRMFALTLSSILDGRGRMILEKHVAKDCLCEDDEWGVVSVHKWVEVEWCSLSWEKGREGLVLYPVSRVVLGPERSYVEHIWFYAEAFEEEKVVWRDGVLEQVYDKIKAIKDALNEWR